MNPMDLTPEQQWAQVPEQRFAQTPAEALQCLIDTRRTQESVIHRVQGGDTLLGRYSALRDEADFFDWRAFVDKWQPYYWSRATADLVRAASDSYPLKAEQAFTLAEATARRDRGEPVSPPSYLPRLLNAFCVFSHPALVVTWQGKPMALSALGWNAVVARGQDNAILLSLNGIHWATNGQAHVVWRSLCGSAGATDDTVALMKWVCSAAMFLEQTIITTRAATLDRAARRRCEKVGQDTTCHVVQLRAAIEAEHAESGEHTVEWSHRWMVRGHWRRQFFPSRHANAPVWIHPHIKGPDDKPFADPKPTVFSVNR